MDYSAWGAIECHTRLLGAFFMNCKKVGSVSPILSKSGFATINFALQVTLTREAFLNILNVLIYRGWSIYNVVEGWQQHCWFCGAIEHLAKLCAGKNPAPIRTVILKEIMGPEKVNQAPSEWTTMVKKGTKAPTPPPQQEAGSLKKQQQEQRQPQQERHKQEQLQQWEQQKQIQWPVKQQQQQEQLFNNSISRCSCRSKSISSNNRTTSSLRYRRSDLS